MATKPILHGPRKSSLTVSSQVVEFETEERVQFIDLTELVTTRTSANDRKRP